MKKRVFALFLALVLTLGLLPVSALAEETELSAADLVRDAIAAKYAASGIAADANAPWLAADMAAYAIAFPGTAYCLTDSQKQEYLNKLIPLANAATKPGDLAKYIIAFRAMGYDARNVVTADATIVDVVEKLTDLVDAGDKSVVNQYTLPYVMIALQQGEGYATEAQLAYLKNSAVSSKASWQNTQWGTDGTTPMILALAPYYGEEEIKAAVDEAVAAVKAKQKADGSIGNAASTGLALAAIAALGEDCAAVKAEGSDQSLIDGLMTQVNDTGDGFKPVSNTFSTEQGLRGLVAVALQKQGQGRVFDFASMPMETARINVPKCPVRFSVVPDSASVEVKLSDTVQIPDSADVYDLPAGSYTYTVTNTGYRTANGSFEVTADEAAAHTEKNISVSLAALEKIEVTSPPAKTAYFPGDAFDPAGMVVTATFDDGTTREITEYTVSPETLTGETTAVTVSFEGKTASVSVTMQTLELTGIAVTTLPAKTSYTVGESFETTGMVVTGTYNNGTTKVLEDYSYTPTGALQAGDSKITVTCQGKTAEITIQVAPVTPPKPEDPAKEHREKALKDLKAQFNKYVQADYTSENWAELKAAYNAGIAAIKAAPAGEPPYVENAIVAALNDAIAAMQAVPSDPGGTVTVAVSMDANTLGLGYLIKPTLVEVPRGTKASVVLTDLLAANGYKFDKTGSIENGFYLEGISPVDQHSVVIPDFILEAAGGENNIWYQPEDNWLGEFCYYNMSGWMFSVNGKFPGVGAASWNMSDGEVMRWQFTVYGYGADLNADNKAWGSASLVPKLGNKDSLTWTVAGLRARYSDSVLEENKTYQEALTVLTDPQAAQSQINAREKALKNVSFDVPSSSDPSGTTTPGDSASATTPGQDIPLVGQPEAGKVSLKPQVSAGKDGSASATVTEKDMNAAIAQAKTGKFDEIVIVPEVKGEAGKVSVELPKAGVAAVAGQTGAALSVVTDLGTVTIPRKSLEELGKQSGSKVTVSAEALKTDGQIKIEIAVDGKPVEKLSGGLVAAVPVKEAGPGSVLVLVNADGSETVIKKSALDGETLAGLVDGSCTVKAVDNAKPFFDIEGHWAKDAVAFASARGLVNGTGAGCFEPDSAMSRSMLATLLYRLEDAKADDGISFADVEENAWYSDAVAWAHASGIVQGTGDGFEPGRSITRQELVTMLYRYAKIVGMDTNQAADLGNYSDSKDVAGWAGEAMEWAVACGLVSGRTADTLDPAGTATRGEAVAIVQKLVGLMVK